MTRITMMTGMLLSFALAGAVPTYNRDDVKLSGLEVRRDGSRMNVNCRIDASGLRLKSNQEVCIVPLLTAGADTVMLTPVTVAGRNRLIYHERNNDTAVDGSEIFHNGKDAASIGYAASVPFEEWMGSSALGYTLTWSGCCGTPFHSGAEIIADVELGAKSLNDFLMFIEPEATGEKLRHVDGKAFIDFPVNKTVINADYRNNAVELSKISGTIDKVRNDKDVTITSIAIKGFASPEGPYVNNARLAAGRTDALVNYVRDLYRFPSSVKFVSDSEPEDWQGLKAYLEKSNVPGHHGIIDIINSGMLPDEKEAKIKKTYPADYDWLLANVFPGLRHSDYVIEYIVKEYTDVAEILKVMRTDPSKLSLAELYFAAKSSDPGSEEFNEIFETAARLHPIDFVANLNAANASLSRGDTEAAARYLEKAGDTPQTQYSRAVMMIMNNDYESARKILEGLKDIPQASEVLDRLDEIQRQREGYATIKAL